MELNSLIFPAPRPSYDLSFGPLYYIPRMCKRSKSIKSTQQIDNKVVKIQVIGGESRQLTSSSEIITILQCTEFMDDGMIVFFHGNAEDIGMCRTFAYGLSQELKMCSICMEYPGYGIAQGDCSSDQMIKDAYCLMEHLIEDLKIPQQKLLLIGRSIGSGLAVEMAVKYKYIKCLVLLSAFRSLRSVIEENSLYLISLLVKDRFKNIEKMPLIQCPTFLIHGTADSLISYKHSVDLLNACKGISFIELAEGMTHNSFLLMAHIVNPIKNFLLKLINQ